MLGIEIFIQIKKHNVCHSSWQIECFIINPVLVSIKNTTHLEA